MEQLEHCLTFSRNLLAIKALKKPSEKTIIENVITMIESNKKKWSNSKSYEGISKLSQVAMGIGKESETTELVLSKIIETLLALAREKTPNSPPTLPPTPKNKERKSELEDNWE